MPANCPESFDMSFLKWVWTSRKQYFEMMQTAHEKVPRDKTRHRFRSLRAVNAFLKSQGG